MQQGVNGIGSDFVNEYGVGMMPVSFYVWGDLITKKNGLITKVYFNNHSCNFVIFAP
jgi:hypothetical protein